jgi:hypothetical protein
MGIGVGEVILFLFVALLGFLIAVLAVVKVLRQASMGGNRVSELESRVERLERQLDRASEPAVRKSAD